MQTKPFRIILHLPQDAPLMPSPRSSPRHPLYSSIPSLEFKFTSAGNGSSWAKTNIKIAPRSQKMSQCFFHLISREREQTSTMLWKKVATHSYQSPPVQPCRGTDAFSSLCPFQQPKKASSWQPPLYKIVCTSIT